MIILVETRLFYARKWLLYLIATISLIPVFTLIVSGIVSGKNINAFIVVLLVAIAINFLVYSLLNRIRIAIDDYGITYQSIFRKRLMAWKDIRETKVVVEMGSKSNQHFWYFISTDNKQIRFNIALFSRKTIRAVAETVIQQSPHALVNEKVVAYSQGKFPWYAI